MANILEMMSSRNKGFPSDGKWVKCPMLNHGKCDIARQNDFTDTSCSPRDQEHYREFADAEKTVTGIISTCFLTDWRTASELRNEPKTEKLPNLPQNLIRAVGDFLRNGKS